MDESGDAAKSDGKKFRKKDQMKKRKRSTSAAFIMTMHAEQEMTLLYVILAHQYQVNRLLKSRPTRMKWKPSGSITRR